MKKLLILALLLSGTLWGQLTSINLSGSTVTCSQANTEVGENTVGCAYLITNNTGSTFTWFATPFVAQAYPFTWDNTTSYTADATVIYAVNGHWYRSLSFSNVGHLPTDVTNWQDEGATPQVVTVASDGEARWRTWGEGCNPSVPSSGSYAPAQWSFPSGAQCGLTCYGNPNVAGATTGHCYLLNPATGSPMTTITLNVTGTSIPLSGGATLPQASVDATYTAPTSCTTTVSTAGALTTALASLSCGQTICIQAGSTSSGNFTIPAIGSPCTAETQITTSDYPNITAPGTRIAPSFVSHMAKVQDASGSPVFTFADGIFGPMRVVGLEITSSAPASFLLASASHSTMYAATLMPKQIVIDRNYLHTSGTTGGFGIALDGSFAVVDSYIDMEGTDETQGINTTTSNGPILIRNNYVKAVGENIMLGGADSRVLGATPQDVTITGNYFFKPLTWDQWCTGATCGSVVWDGISRAVKNLFEFKKCVRCLVQGNVLANNWVAAQDGSGVLFEPTNQSGSDLTAQDRDITFQYNYIHGAFFGMNHNSSSYAFPSASSKHWTIQNNVWDHIGDAAYGVGVPYGINNWGAAHSGSSFFRWHSDDTADADVWIQHNDILGDSIGGFFNIQASTTQINGFNLKNNLLAHGTYGLIINGTTGTANIATIWTSIDLAKNVMIGTNPGTYDSDFLFAANTGAVGFTNYATGNYLLTSGSAYHNAATDGKDYGADIATLNIMTACSVSGCNPNSGTVTISPGSATIPVLGTQQFSTSPTGATYSLSTGCPGSITSGGFFTATSRVGSCTITATVSTNSGTATVNVQALTVAPSTVSLNVGATQQFTSNFSSSWSATCGSITSSGLYTAPSTNGTCTITATAVNGGTTATATATISGQQTFIPLSVTPTSWTQTTSISTAITKAFGVTNIGTGTVTPAATFTGPAPFSISANTCTGALTGSSNCSVTVRFFSATVGSFSATLQITDTAGGSTTIPISISIPTGTLVTVSPKTATLPVNGTQVFSVSTSNGSTVNWTATCGTFSGTAYTAPSSANVCTVTATATDGSGSTDTAIVTVVTIAVNPSAVTMQINSTQQFTANVPVSWSAGCGTMNAISGSYTAPASPASCSIVATANNGGATGTATATVVNPPPGTTGGKWHGRGNPHKFH